MKKNKENLIERVDKCKKTLKDIGFKNTRYFFARKYPEYYKGKKSIDRLDNLFFMKITDEAFTEKLEAFTAQKEIEFK